MVVDHFFCCVDIAEVTRVDLRNDVGFAEIAEFRAVCQANLCHMSFCLLVDWLDNHFGQEQFAVQKWCLIFYGSVHCFVLGISSM